MRVEAGKYYKAECGVKVGPMTFREQDRKWLGAGLNTVASSGEPTGHPQVYNTDGSVFCQRSSESGHVLISEWVDGPARTTTRTEIVEGQYGRLHVVPHEPGSVLLGLNSPDDLQFTSFTAPELTDAIATLTAIRDALVEVA